MLGELQELTEELTRRYPWQDAQATWFVLTGEVPGAPPVKTSYRLPSSIHHIDATIILEMAPWVPIGTACKALHSAQRRALWNRNNQQIGEKNLKPLRFVLERTEPTGLLREGKDEAPDSVWMTTDELTANLGYEKVPESLG